MANYYKCSPEEGTLQKPKRKRVVQRGQCLAKLRHQSLARDSVQPTSKNFKFHFIITLQTVLRCINH